jgi:hypothetical protein
VSGKNNHRSMLELVGRCSLSLLTSYLLLDFKQRGGYASASRFQNRPAR